MVCPEFLLDLGMLNSLKKEVPNLIQNQNIQSECSNILNSRHTFFFQGALSKKVYCLQRSSFRFLLKDSLLTAFPIPFSRIQEVISPFFCE